MNNVLRKTQKLVRQKMLGEGSGHDWWHIDRVRRNALSIAKSENKADLIIVELAALTHDLDDWKFRKTKEPVNTLAILKKAGLDKDSIKRILDITENISFKLGTNHEVMKSLEGKIVQDADRLDAIGAIGIARLFTFGGSKGREIHNPEKKLVRYKSIKQLKWSTNTSFHHFEEKLLHLKNLINTKTGKQMALSRHKFMLTFLEEFHKEWKGKV